MSLISKLRKASQKELTPCSVVIAAAGSSARMAGDDKLFALINGVPVLAHTLRAFQNCALVDEIIVVTRQEMIERVTEMCRTYGIVKAGSVIPGGETRFDSVSRGVFAVSKKSRLIAIHDGARPCISGGVIERTISSAAKYSAAAPAVPVWSTVKSVSKGVVTETINRENLVEIQTPQVFDSDLIKAALTKAVSVGELLTDDCMAVEMLGVPVHITEGSRSNIKLTEPGDILIAAAILGGKDMRVGYGYDAHRLKIGRKCVLCGVEIESELGPDGHSDADVPLHALMDALLGAAALGDIGSFFPDTDERWHMANSVELLKKINAVIGDHGYRLGNADITIVLESPRVSAHISRMRTVVAEALGTDVSNISIKATTEEKMGFTGEGTGISSSAVVLLENSHFA